GLAGARSRGGRLPRGSETSLPRTLVSIELAHAVGLRPRPHLPGHRLGERVLEQELVVEPAAQLRSLHGNLHPMPLSHLNVHVVHALLDEAALAALEGPEHEVVLFTVEADGEVVAVRLEVEQDPGALIELPAEEAEAHGD